MKTKLSSIFFFVYLFSAIAGEEVTPAKKIIFEENKNQWPKQVMFEADFAGGKLFLEKSTFTYLFIENVDFHGIYRKEKDSAIVHYHSFKVNFQNSNPDTDVSGSNLFSFHRNYYRGNNPSSWADGVKLYSKVSYKNLYPSIDMDVYSAEQNLKYDLIINPGGAPENIKFDYDGTDKMQIKNGNLYIQTSVGTVIEQKPYAYQIIDGIKKGVSCSYELRKHTLSFSINGKYNKNLPLVIDPTLVASTYTGAFGDNWGFTATYDDSGNIYTAGIAAYAGYPTTVGAWDNTFNGGSWANNSYPFDISITKYNTTGSAILFSTYYGGSNNEQPHSLFVNSSNELFLTGRTNSTNFPVTAGAYDVTYNGGFDIIVGKFNSSGALLASTFVGGTGDDGVNIYAQENLFGSLKFNYADDGRSEIILDNSSNVYIAGSTRSTNFPTSAGAFDNTLGGAQDGCVFKMNSTLSSLIFSTYLGGSADDAAYGLKLEGNNNVYVTGGTASSNFPTTAGVFHPTFQGGMADGFIAALNNTGTSLLYSTYLGTSAYDQSYMIETDANSDIYVYGQTKGAYPVTPGVYSNPNSGQFIHKLNKQLNTSLFSTVIGTGTPNPNISPTAFLVDSCQSIYIAGWGRCNWPFFQPSPSTVTGMPITSNAYKSITDGCDFYFMVLKPNAQSLLYGTFFGENSPVGDHVDGGTSRFDKRGFIYQSVCASCGGSDNFPTTPTAWSTTNNSSNCNNAVIKMSLRVDPIASAGMTGPPTGCAPYTVPFNITGSVGTNFLWNFGDGSPMTTILSPTHTYPNVGNYIVSLYVWDSTGVCGKIDTANVIVHVVTTSALTTSQTSVLCYGGNTGTATVTAAAGLSPFTYLWSNTQTTMLATGLSAGTYNVNVTNVFGCHSTASVTIVQPIALTANATFTNVGCSGGSNGTATATASGGTGPYTYLWLPGGYTTSSIAGLSINSYTVTVTDSKGCTIASVANITQPPALSITAATVPASCAQSNGSASVTGAGGFAPYTWTWSGGQTGANAAGLAAGTYTVTIHDLNLCTYSIPISIANVSGPAAVISSINVLCNGANNGTATIITSGGILPFTYLWSNGQTTPTASNLGVGIYSVIATDSHNCSATASVTIAEPIPLAANAIAVNPACFGFHDGIALISALGGTPPYTYVWAIPGNPTNDTVTGLGSGVYNVTITDFKGCIKIASVTLTDPNTFSAAISNTSVLCSGDCNGTATVAASNGFSPYTYLWSDNAHQQTASATGLCAALYSVTVTDFHGCPANAAATIGSPLPLTASFASIGNASCFGLCDGFAQITPIGGTPPYNYNWMPGARTTAAVTGLCAGTFTCTITDAHGCNAISIDSIIQPAQIIGAVTVFKTPCNGICDGEIIANYAGGVPPYSYLWMPGLQTINHPANLCAGSNTVTITDANGCNTGGAIVLTAPPALTVNTSSVSSNCGQANGQACAVAAGGTLPYNYLWNSSLTDTLDCAAGLVANTYNVTVTDGMGCVVISNANINDITGPAVAITASADVSCFGIADGTAAAVITGGVSPYSKYWTPGGQTVQNPLILSAGVNTLTVTDNAGCVGSASITIGTPPEIVSAVTGIHNVSCYGVCDGTAGILYGGGIAPLSIIWNDPGTQTSSPATGLCAGTYNVTITDASGCKRIDTSAVITQPNALVIQSSTVYDITCFGDNNGVISAAVSGGTPYYTFNWTPNVSAGATAANLVSGSYTLNVLDLKGCTAMLTKNISEPAVLSASSSVNPSSCNFNNGSASAVPSGGTTPYNYQWNDTSLQTTASAQNLTAGSYVCTITDTNGCSISAAAVVSALPGPMIDSITATPVLCNGGNTGTGMVFTTAGMGALPLNYLWTPSAITNDTANGLQQGVNNVLITDANGCTTNGAVVITQPPVLYIMVSPIDTVCYLDTAQIYAQAVGGTPNYVYTWLGASGTGLLGSGPHLVFPASNTIYSVSVVDANGCAAGPKNMEVIIPSPLSVSAASNVLICNGSSAVISATASGGNGGPYNYSWSNGSASQSQTVSPSIAVSPASYIVTVTDGCSQPSIDTSIVIVSASPSGTFSESDSSGCQPLTVNFNASSNTPGITYTWDFGDLTIGSGSSASHIYVNDSVYNVILTISTSAGCTALLGGNNPITVYPLPSADFSINPNPASSLYPLVNYTDLSSTVISSWFWNFGDSISVQNTSILNNPNHTYSGFGSYTAQLIVINQFGCIDTVKKTIEVKDEFVFYAPNTFTPNYDDVNDIFLPVGVGYDVNTFRFYIFSRWGELIFYSDDYTKGWNGIANHGKEIAQIDVYVWKVDLTDNRGLKHKYIGHVNLVK